MHPALSVIFFTTLSGAGYGLWSLLALALLTRTPLPAAAALGAGMIGLVLVSVGLLSSLLHLGQPQRAWRALSQWRSSWLSREGVAALATYLPALVLLLTLGALLRGAASSAGALAALHAAAALLLLGCGATVFCTARIYTSLTPIAAWRNGYVLPVYLLLALYSGALWAWVIAALGGAPRDGSATLALYAAIALGAPAASLLKHLYWRRIDAAASGPTRESATGLAALGRVRSVETPHSEDNYLTREMGFVLARKHGDTLRRIALLLGCAAPLLLLNLALTFPAANAVCAVLALLAGSAGIFVERWLFFAQARHTVMLYYGAERA